MLWRSLSDALANREIKESVRKIAPGIVNPHCASGYGFSTALSKVWKRKPVVLHCLGSDILISPEKSIAHRRKVTYALSKASLIFADSRYVIDKIQKLYHIDNYEIIPWGVERAILDIYRKRQPVDFTKKRPLKIFSPRPHNKVYNNVFIIESLKEFIIKKEIALTFSSRGDDFEKFRNIVSEQYPEALIDFYDFKERREYIDFLSSFDVYLSASLSDSSPASLIESMAAGLFPVVGDIPGVHEWADSGNTILFDPHSGDMLHDAINSLLNSFKGTENILKANHEKVIERGLFSENIEKTIKAMEGLVEDAG